MFRQKTSGNNSQEISVKKYEFLIISIKPCETNVKTVSKFHCYIDKLLFTIQAEPLLSGNLETLPLPDNRKYQELNFMPYVRP